MGQRRVASWHEGPGAGDKEEPAVGLWLGIRKGWHPRGLLGVPVVFENCEGAGDGRLAQCAGPRKQMDSREENSVSHQSSLTRNSEQNPEHCKILGSVFKADIIS